MLREVYEINKQGFVINVDTANIDESGNILDEDKKHMIAVGYQGLYKAKWNDAEWIEGATQEELEERESQHLLESLKPSQNEIANAELEIKILTMLTELGVVQ